MYDDLVPFTRAEARARGIPDKELRSPLYRTLIHGYYLPSSVRHHPAQAIRAALSVHPTGAVATHYSAARLLGAPVPEHHEVHITVRDADDRRRRRGLRCHALAIDEEDVRLLSGLRVSAPRRIFVELARYLTLVEMVVLGDWLVQHDHCSAQELTAYCAATREQHAGKASQAADLVRSGSESPRESRLRVLLELAGLPTARINPEVHDAAGRFLARLDLAWPDLKLAVEYDGAHHREPGQWESDVERRQRLEAEGWRIIVVTNHQLYARPGEVVARVAAALRDRGVPVEVSNTWRHHFER